MENDTKRKKSDKTRIVVESLLIIIIIFAGACVMRMIDTFNGSVTLSKGLSQKEFFSRVDSSDLEKESGVKNVIYKFFNDNNLATDDLIVKYDKDTKDIEASSKKYNWHIIYHGDVFNYYKNKIYVASIDALSTYISDTDKKTYVEAYMDYICESPTGIDFAFSYDEEDNYMEINAIGETKIMNLRTGEYIE